MSQRLDVGLLTIALIALSCPVLADTVSGDRGTDMVVDAVVVRPLGLVSLLVGTAVTIVTLPFTLPSGSAGAAANAMIVEPAQYTFTRPLGEFDRQD